MILWTLIFPDCNNYLLLHNKLPQVINQLNFIQFMILQIGNLAKTLWCFFLSGLSLANLSCTPSCVCIQLVGHLDPAGLG
jgi:hypothetical protein